MAICTLGSPIYKDRVSATESLDRVYLIPLLNCFKRCPDPEINSRINDILTRQISPYEKWYETWLYNYNRYEYYEKYFGANVYIDDTKFLKDIQGSYTNKEDNYFLHLRKRLIEKNIFKENDDVVFLRPGLQPSDYTLYHHYGELWQSKRTIGVTWKYIWLLRGHLSFAMPIIQKN